MATEVFCPTCGGLLFGDPGAGRPCTCATPAQSSTTGTATAAAAATGGKVCCVCGMNLEGKPRRKDKEGKYWCNECADYDSAQKRLTSGTVCSDCGRSFGKSMITEVEGRPVCRTCAIDREMQAKETKRRLANPTRYRNPDSQKRKKLIVIAVVAVLVLIALYANGVFGSG